MSKNNNVLMSESEIDGGVCVTECIKKSIRDLQSGLCNVEKHLLNMVGDRQ